MTRQFVDLNVYEARNMAKDGIVDFGCWLDKTNEEKLSAASRMLEVAFQQPQFGIKKCDRKFFRL